LYCIGGFRRDALLASLQRDAEIGARQGNTNILGGQCSSAKSTSLVIFFAANVVELREFARYEWLLSFRSGNEQLRWTQVIQVLV
jgi:hypothetical protein